MHKALIGRILITIAGIIGLADVVMMSNQLPIGEYLDRFGLWAHPVTGLLIMFVLAVSGIILLHLAKKTHDRSKLDLFALISGYVLIMITLLFMGIMVLWILLYSF